MGNCGPCAALSGVWDGVRAALPYGRVTTAMLRKACDGRASGRILCNSKGLHPCSEFEIQSCKLGEGGFGSVCLGRSKHTGALRAIKTMSKKEIPNTAAFLKELAISSELDHPNIVRTFESFEDKYQVYIVMEVCDGGEVMDAVLEEGDECFGEQEALVLMRQVMRAVHYMHCKSICHRDLKPGNFLLGQRGVPLLENTLKVIDFGFATSFRPGEQSMRTALGTPHFTAPEILSGPYDEKCDIWSCGVILYLFLCGSPPFDADATDEILALAARGKLHFEGPEWTGVSGKAKALIIGMCKLDPSNRLSAGQVQESPWMHHDAPIPKRSSGMIRNLQRFSALGRFEKAALSIIAQRLDDREIAQLRDMFLRLDADEDGMLEASEVKEAFAKVGLNTEDAKELFDKLDMDGSGRLDYTEFVAAAVRKRCVLQEQACWSAFRVFDKNGNGSISVEELREVLSGDAFSQIGVSLDQAAMILSSADTNRDGHVDFDEFMFMLRNQLSEGSPMSPDQESPAFLSAQTRSDLRAVPTGCA